MPPTPAKRRRSASPMPVQGSSSKEKATPGSRQSSKSPTKSQSNRDWKKHKQQQSHDYNTHQFLDASATVHASLFGARRLPEIKSLWRRIVQGELTKLNEIGDGRPNDAKGKRIDQRAVRLAGESGGGKISSRHLRRRTNSHKRRRRNRYPRGKGGEVTIARKDTECGIDVKGDGEESRDVLGNIDSCPKKISGGHKKQCRRARRKPVLMKMSHSDWWQTQTKSAQMNTKSVSVQMNERKSAHNWIPTHLWHAKRFHVSPPLFSWSIPLIHSNRGSRASLRLASSESHPKCTIQDGTWEANGCVIKLDANNAVTCSPSERQPVKTLLSILQRLCGPDAPFLAEESIIAGHRSGEGLIHEIDTFPLEPIGPATFIFGYSNSDDESQNAHLSILVHPAIHQRVVSLLTTILSSDSDANHKVTVSTESLALLRIRGRASTSSLLGVLQQAENIGLVCEDVDNGDLIKLGTPPTLMVAPNTDTKSISNAITNPFSILLKSHKPNQTYQHLPHNLASSGWDILCHPSIGSSLFQTFVNGGACAIGLAEDARAQLEAHPPLPIFPRDFPDTEEGKAYWEGAMREALANKEGDEDVIQSMATWKDWAVIRTCVEGLWGRINTPLRRTLRHWKQYGGMARKNTEKEKSSTSQDVRAHKLITKGQIFGREVTSIHWKSLLSPDAESTIVVRGSYANPFLQLLHGSGRLYNSTGNTRHRRPRRKVRPPSSIVHASPLSKKDSEAHSSVCQQLLASLSLPALLRCELYCDGKGTLNIGDLIHPLASQDDHDDISEESDLDGCDDKISRSLPLGVVVAGGFSPSRGKCHGIGFVGAAKLMESLDGTDHVMGMPMPQSNGKKMMVVKVLVVGAASSAGCMRFALLSLLS